MFKPKWKNSTICLLEIFILAGGESKKHLQFLKCQGKSAGIGKGGHSHWDCHVDKDTGEFVRSYDGQDSAESDKEMIRNLSENKNQTIDYFNHTLYQALL